MLVRKGSLTCPTDSFAKATSSIPLTSVPRWNQPTSPPSARPAPSENSRANLLKSSPAMIRLCKSAAIAKAADLHKRIIAGEDFSKLAREFSDGAGRADGGVRLRVQFVVALDVVIGNIDPRSHPSVNNFTLLELAFYLRSIAGHRLSFAAQSGFELFIAQAIFCFNLLDVLANILIRDFDTRFADLRFSKFV